MNVPDSHIHRNRLSRKAGSLVYSLALASFLFILTITMPTSHQNMMHMADDQVSYYGKLTYTGEQEKLVRTIIFCTGQSKEYTFFEPYQRLPETAYSNDMVEVRRFEITTEEGARIRNSLDTLSSLEVSDDIAWSLVFITVKNGRAEGREWRLGYGRRDDLYRLMSQSLGKENRAGHDIFGD